VVIGKGKAIPVQP